MENLWHLPTYLSLIGLFSERKSSAVSKPRSLLERVRGIELVELQRADECRGFGGALSKFHYNITFTNFEVS